MDWLYPIMGGQLVEKVREPCGLGAKPFLVGTKCDEKLTKFAILTDQSDAWVVLRMSGDLMEAVLMRLSPVDVRLKTFKTGSVVRTGLIHVNVTLIGLEQTQLMSMDFVQWQKHFVMN